MEKVLTRQEAFGLREEELIEVNVALDLYIEKVNKANRGNGK